MPIFHMHPHGFITKAQKKAERLASCRREAVFCVWAIRAFAAFLMISVTVAAYMWLSEDGWARLLVLWAGTPFLVAFLYGSRRQEGRTINSYVAMRLRLENNREPFLQAFHGEQQ